MKLTPPELWRPLRFVSFVRRSTSLLALFSSLTVLAAPAPTGTVTGHVTNRANGEVLAGAIIHVAGTGITAVAGRDGGYRLVVPAGPQTLEVSFIGLDTATVAFGVSPGQTLVQDVALTSSIYKLDDVVVSGIREADALALQEKREQPAVMEIAPVEAFGIPSPNPGSLLSRMPEVSVDIVGANVRTIYLRGMPPTFETLMIDGNEMASSQGTSAGRNIQIEQFGTGQLKDVELIFAATPDMDADAIGGIINLTTKRSYDVPEGLALTLGTAWHDNQTASDPFQVNAGKLNLINLVGSKTFSVLGGKNNLGVEFNFNHNNQASTTENEAPGLKDMVGAPGGMLHSGRGGNTTGGPLLTSFGAGYFFYPATMNAGGFNVDYKLKEGSFLSLRTTFTQQYYYQQWYRELVQVDNSFANFLPGSTPDNETTQPTAATATSTSGLFTKKSKNYSINPEFVYTVLDGAGVFDVNGMFSYANVWYPNMAVIYASDSGVGFNVTRTGYNAWTPKFTQTAGPSIYDAKNYVPNYLYQYTYAAPDQLAQARVDYRQDFRAPVPSFVKVGVKASSELRQGEASYSDYDVYNGPTTGITPWLGAYFKPGGLYGPFPFLNIPYNGAKNDIVAQNYFAQNTSDVFGDVTATLAGLANYRESIYSGYVEGSTTLNKFTVLGGLRVEDTHVHAQQLTQTPVAEDDTLTLAQEAALAASQFKGMTTVDGQYRNVFPGLFLTYEPQSGLIFKGSYNVAISRPPVTNVLPGETIDPSSRTISIDNINLKPYQSQNFDLSISKYFEPVGLVEAGVFLKEVSNYIASQTYQIGSGGDPAMDQRYSRYPGYTLSTDVNYGSARFRGVYFNYQQRFSFLPGFLSGLGAFGNGTFLETQGNYGKKQFYENLAGFTPFTANFGLTYVYKGLQLRVSGNYKSNYLVLGTPGTTSAVTQLHRTLININGDYALNRRIDLFFEADNITNEYTIAYVYEGKPYSAYKQGVVLNAGVRLRFK